MIYDNMAHSIGMRFYSDQEPTWPNASNRLDHNKVEVSCIIHFLSLSTRSYKDSSIQWRMNISTFTPYTLYLARKGSQVEADLALVQQLYDEDAVDKV